MTTPVDIPVADAGTYDYVVLGAGLAGLSTAMILGERCVVLEREDRPGGLVRSEYIEGYWFDHVLHLLHFQHDTTETTIKPLLIDELEWCSPVAWVETAAGVTRFPFQMNLGGLEQESVVSCVRDLAEVCFSKNPLPPENMHEALLRKFGQSMCDIFMHPYNRKMWRRPLETLAPGISWTVTVPHFEEVIRGTLSSKGQFRPYNARGWYPRPESGSEPRGMERLSMALASRIADLRCSVCVEHVDLAARKVIVSTSNSDRIQVSYRKGLVSTIPMPTLVSMLEDPPTEMIENVKKLTWNRVYSVMLPIRGDRPKDCGHWRYYANEKVCFTRIIHMHAFDPLSAPEDGWGLLVEVTEDSAETLSSPERIIELTLKDLDKVSAVPKGSRILPGRVVVNDPAYVVFTRGTEGTVSEVLDYLLSNDVHSVGRYGRWEYSSMAQVITDGLELGGTLP